MDLKKIAAVKAYILEYMKRFCVYKAVEKS
jgi:hypothetical protein